MQSRQLGYYERFSLARSNAGVAASVVFHCSFKERKLSQPDLHVIINDLLAEYPLLRARIQDHISRKPQFVEIGSIDVGDIVSIATEEVDEDKNDRLRRRLEHGMRVADAIDVSKGPLWRIITYTGGRNDAVLLVVHHTLSDGLGTKTLFAEIIQRLLRDRISSSQTTVDKVDFSKIPPSQEQSLAAFEKLSWPFFLGLLWSEVIQPALPFGLGSKSKKVVFPNPPLVPPYQQETTVRVLHLPNGLIAKVKARAKLNGIATLHPVLETALLASLLHVSKQVHPRINYEFKVETPLSLRTPTAGHPILTGNYVVSLSTPPTYETATSETPFFDLTKSCATHLSLAATRTYGEQGMLSLSLIPDPVIANGAAETGWEKWILEKAKNEKSTWSMAIDASNLGIFSVDQEGENEIQELGWAQPGSVMSAAIGFNIVSGPAEMTITLSFRKGTIREETVKGIAETFMRAMQRLGEGKDSRHELYSLADLVH